MFGDLGAVTIIILGVTIFVSYRAMNDMELKSKLLFNPYAFKHLQQRYRLVSHGLVHGSWIHLGVNMFVLWQFGSEVEKILVHGHVHSGYHGHFEGMGQIGLLVFLVLYVGGMVFATLPSIQKHSNNSAYNSLGASGAISALVIAYIIFNPTHKLGFLFIPIPIPAWVMGLIFFAYESYMNKKGQGRIAHDAHLWGAFFGILFIMAVDFDLLVECISTIRRSLF